VLYGLLAAGYVLSGSALAVFLGVALVEVLGAPSNMPRRRNDRSRRSVSAARKG
jgi:hypothetical protein